MYAPGSLITYVFFPIFPDLYTALPPCLCCWWPKNTVTALLWLAKSPLVTQLNRVVATCDFLRSLGWVIIINVESSPDDWQLICAARDEDGGTEELLFQNPINPGKRFPVMLVQSILWDQCMTGNWFEIFDTKSQFIVVDCYEVMMKIKEEDDPYLIS